MTQSEITLNNFLVGVFNDILRLEEHSLLRYGLENISVTEMHIIDAVFNAEQAGTNTMALLAKKVDVTASTLTIGVKTLEQKGYLQRTHSKTDRRKVLVTVTPLAQNAVKHHVNFHKKMVEAISGQLTEFEIQTLSMALSKLHTFFTDLKK